MDTQISNTGSHTIVWTHKSQTLAAIPLFRHKSQTLVAIPLFRHKSQTLAAIPLFRQISNTGSHTIVWTHKSQTLVAIPSCGHTNLKHWQPYHCVDTKLRHTLTGMGSAALAAAVPLPRVGDPNFLHGINAVLIPSKRAVLKVDVLQDWKTYC